MAADWYFKEMGEEVGPVSANTLRKYAQEGRIAKDTYVRTGTDGKWLWAERVKGLFDPSPPIAKTPSKDQAKEPAPQLSPVEKACPSCQTVLPPGAVLCVHCGFDLRTGKAFAKPMKSMPVKKSGAKKMLIGGIGAAGFLAIALALFFVIPRGDSPPKHVTAASSPSEKAQQEINSKLELALEREAEVARQKAAKEKEALRLAELASQKAEQDKEALRLAEAARQKAEKLKEAELAQKKTEQEKEAKRLAELARRKTEMMAANPLAKAAALPKEPRPARILRQIEALPKNGLDRWLAALKNATGAAESRKDILFFLCDFNRLYDKKSFRDDESAKLINRMKMVPKAEIDTWNNALSKTVGGRLIPSLSDKSAALVVIIQQDLLFKAQAFDRTMSQVLCQRLATIPRSAVDEVASVGNQNSALDDTDAALAIAAFDPLFVDNQFQPDVWQAIMAEQQRKR